MFHTIVLIDLILVEVMKLRLPLAMTCSLVIAKDYQFPLAF